MQHSAIGLLKQTQRALLYSHVFHRWV